MVLLAVSDQMGLISTAVIVYRGNLKLINNFPSINLSLKCRASVRPTHQKLIERFCFLPHFKVYHLLCLSV